MDFVIQHSYLIPLLPLAGAVIAGFFGARWLKGQSHWPIWLGVGVSAVLSIALLFGMIGRVSAERAEGGGHANAAKTATGEECGGEGQKAEGPFTGVPCDWFTWIQAGDPAADVTNRKAKPAAEHHTAGGAESPTTKPAHPAESRYDAASPAREPAGTHLIYEIKPPEGTPNPKLADEVIRALRRRVDPNGVRNLVWRPAAPDKLEVVVPPAAGAGRDNEVADLKRLIAGSGVLEFHTLAFPAGRASEGVSLPPGEYERLAKRLAEQGPKAEAGDAYRWLEVAKPDEVRVASLEKHDGRSYVLVSYKPEDSIDGAVRQVVLGQRPPRK